VNSVDLTLKDLILSPPSSSFQQSDLSGSLVHFVTGQGLIPILTICGRSHDKMLPDTQSSAASTLLLPPYRLPPCLMLRPDPSVFDPKRVSIGFLDLEFVFQPLIFEDLAEVGFYASRRFSIYRNQKLNSDFEIRFHLSLRMIFATNLPHMGIQIHNTSPCGPLLAKAPLFFCS